MCRVDILVYYFLLCSVFIQLEEAKPITGDLTSAATYLSRYGYLKKPSKQGSAALTSQDTLISALKDFQSFAGLNATGELDNATLEKMATPRCGVEDMDPNNSDTHIRRKRYEIHGSRWRIRNLTYSVTKYSRRLSKEQVDREIARAFQMWSNHTKLTFNKWPGGNAKIHIDIRFETGDHGDWDQFDGPDGTLAHAYFPYYGGNVHFDDDENWTVSGNQEGTSLFQIAVHELGHALGLHHSDVVQAVMGPYHKNYTNEFQLHQDDIEGITYLYGGLGNRPSTTASPNIWINEPTSNSLCEDRTFDTIFTNKKGQIYVFKGELAYRLDRDGVEQGYPHLISDEWPGLPDKIDAAFTHRNGKTFFFKGDEYWRYVNYTMDGNYPKKISDGFSGIPSDIDAVFQWAGNFKIYFFKGNLFWKYDPMTRPAVGRHYPKDIDNWLGIPSNLDGALVYQGWTFFFKENNYYRFDDEEFAVDDGEPPFPRPTSSWWFGCDLISD